MSISSAAVRSRATCSRSAQARKPPSHRWNGTGRSRIVGMWKNATPPEVSPAHRLASAAACDSMCSRTSMEITRSNGSAKRASARSATSKRRFGNFSDIARSEEHTSELQSRLHLVCRLLLEKKKKQLSHVSHDPIDHQLE